MATKFVDCLGREWEFRITVRTLPKLRAAGFDVGECAKGDGFLPLANPETLGAVLWVLCEADTTKRSITEEQFADGFDGPTIYAATTALMEAVADFIQSPTVAAATKRLLSGAIAAKEAEIVKKIEAWTGSNESAGSAPDSLDSTPAG